MGPGGPAWGEVPPRAYDSGLARFAAHQALTDGSLLTILGCVLCIGIWDGVAVYCAVLVVLYVFSVHPVVS